MTSRAPRQDREPTGMPPMPTQHDLAVMLSKRKTMVLKTFKKDGATVATPVSVAVEGDRIFFRTYTKTWKFKRLRRNPLVEVAPSTFRGKPRGATLPARARLLEAESARTARQALARRHPVLQRLLVPTIHRLSGYTTVHYEIAARADAGSTSSTGFDGREYGFRG